MDWLTDFTTTPVRFLHLDINSCFTSIEQQANPHLRHQPTVVVARLTPSGCVLASSYEAKALGIKTGTRLNEALKLCPHLNVLPPDPDKYRHVHHQLKQLILSYTHHVCAWSIDEFNLDLTYNQILGQDLQKIAWEIKARLKKEIGDYLTVSIGLAPSSYLAKIAAGIQKPDGLVTINRQNYLSLYSHLKVTDLCGINHRLNLRLSPLGITTAADLYHASFDTLRAGLGATAAHYWRLRLRGFPIALADQPPKSFGHSFVLPRPLPLPQTLPIFHQLLLKATRRMRRKNFQAQSLGVYLGFTDHSFWNQHLTVQQPFFDDQTALHLLNLLLRQACLAEKRAPQNLLIKHTAVTCFSVSSSDQLQLNLFTDRLKQTKLTQALDRLNQTYGGFTIAPASAFFVY